MLRYYIVATAIVVAFVGIIAGVQHVRSELKVATVQASGTPSAPRPQGTSTYRPGALRGTAPWALEALTNCFRHLSIRRGPRHHVLAQLPRDAQMLAPGDVVVAGPCSLRFDGQQARVVRAGGPDEGVDLIVPPPIALYFRRGSARDAPWHGDVVFLVTFDRDGGARLERLGTPPGTHLLTKARD